MKGWKAVEFGDIATFRNGLNFRSNNQGTGCKILGVPDFSNRLLPDYGSLKEINPEGIVKEADYLNVGDIVFVRSNGNKALVGRSLYINEVPEPLVYSGFCIRARMNSDTALPIFLAYFFRTDLFRELLSSVAGGANIQNLNQVLLSRAKVPLPPLPTQRRIASILSAYDDLIENNLKRIKLLEELAQRTYDEWFVRFTIKGKKLEVDEKTGLPEGWERKTLGEVVDINKNSIKKGCQGRIRYVDISAVSTGNIDSWTECDFYDAPGRARRILTHGDIIWSCVRPKNKSYSIVWNPEKNLVGSTGFAVISPKFLPSTYLYFLITTESFVGYLTNHATGSAYPAVKAIDFSRAEVIIPGENLLITFNNFAEPIFDKVSILKVQNRLLKEARDIFVATVDERDYFN